MTRIKRVLRTVLTNWIHLIVFYIATYLTLILFRVFRLSDGDWESAILTGFVSTFLLFIVYGPIIIGWFYLAVISMDILLFSRDNRWTKEKLLLEWLIISIPFIYWAFKYEYWLWINLSISFLTTQLLRKRLIERNGDLEIVTWQSAGVLDSFELTFWLDGNPDSLTNQDQRSTEKLISKDW